MNPERDCIYAWPDTPGQSTRGKWSCHPAKRTSEPYVRADLYDAALARAVAAEAAQRDAERERDAAKSEVADMRNSGSWYQEKDIDRFQAIEKAAKAYVERHEFHELQIRAKQREVISGASLVQSQAQRLGALITLRAALTDSPKETSR